MTPWPDREFDGYISYPDRFVEAAVSRNFGKEGLQCVKSLVLSHPLNKVISRRTHLLAHRPNIPALVKPLMSKAVIPKKL